MHMKFDKRYIALSVIDDLTIGDLQLNGYGYGNGTRFFQKLEASITVFSKNLVVVCVTSIIKSNVGNVHYQYIKK